jgi:exodeoxyribonuclease VII small subunit
MAEPKFEKDLEQLEKIVGQLEEGELSLDDALKQFEAGIKLAKRCEKALSKAEKRIAILTKNAEGELEAEPFGESEDEAGEDTPAKAAPADAADAEDDSDDAELLF